jgi:hypothetical protein
MATLITTPDITSPGGFVPPDGDIYPFTLQASILTPPPLAIISVSAPLPNDFIIHQISVMINGGTPFAPAMGNFRLRVGVGETPVVDDFDDTWVDLLGVDISGVETGINWAGFNYSFKWDMHRRFSGKSLRLAALLAILPGKPGYEGYFTLMIGV